MVACGIIIVINPNPNLLILFCRCANSFGLLHPIFVIVTQPRLISAVSVANRVVMKRVEDLGTAVAYSVTFESALPRPYDGILVCTVVVLLHKLEISLMGCLA